MKFDLFNRQKVAWLSYQYERLNARVGEMEAEYNKLILRMDKDNERNNDNLTVLRQSLGLTSEQITLNESGYPSKRRFVKPQQEDQ